MRKFALSNMLQIYESNNVLVIFGNFCYTKMILANNQPLNKRQHFRHRTTSPAKGQTTHQNTESNSGLGKAISQQCPSSVPSQISTMAATSGFRASS